MSHELSRLVDRGEIEEALHRAEGLTPQKVRELLLSGDGFMKNSAPYGEFISRWYTSLNSPYLRAEAADWFAQAYLTEIADLPNAEQIGAEMATESKKQVIAHLAQSIDGKDLADWAMSPEKPLSPTQLQAWKKASRQLREISIP
jgi:hypothetical protein